MTNKHRITVPKPLFYRVIEFTKSLQILRDSMKLIEEGKHHMFIPLYGQLRSLIAEKSGKNPSLMFEISAKHAVPLEFYCTPIKNYPSELPIPIFHFIAPQISLLESPGLGQEKISLAQFLERNIMTLEGKGYSTKEIIRSLANIAGGSHYASAIPKNIAELFSFGLNRLNEFKKIGISDPNFLNGLIFQIGYVVYQLGLNLLSNICNFEIFIHFYLPKQKLQGNAYLLDIVEDNSSMRMSMLFDKDSQPKFIIQGANKMAFETKINGIKLDNKLYLLSISYSITDNLNTKIEICINNHIVFHKEFEDVLAFKNDLNSFQLYLNCSIEDKNEGMNVGLLQYFSLAKLLSYTDRMRVSNFILNKFDPEKKLAWYTKGSFGYSSPKSNTLINDGTVKLVSINSLIVES